MNIRKRGLSRGLNELLSNKVFVEPNAIDAPYNTINLLINKLTPGKFQPRKSISTQEVTELAESVKTQGILQPLIVRQLANDQYEIIAGERRWQAAKLAELKEVPVIIRNVTDKEALTIALIENIQRQDLNAIEEAMALDRLSKEFALTHAELAIAVGKSRTAVTNLIRVLNLPKEIKIMLEKQQLDLGHAKVIMNLPNNLQLQIANKIIENNLSVRATEQLLSKLQTNENILNTKADKSFKLTIDPNIMKLQKRLSDHFGARVNILNKPKGNGKLVIAYNSLDELEGILDHILVTEDL